MNLNPNACEVSKLRNLPLNCAVTQCGSSLNHNPYEVNESRMSALNAVMEALTDPNISTIGLSELAGANIVNVLEKVSRRAKRDNLFDVILMASIRKKPDLRRVQEEIADALGLKFDEECKTARASRLSDRLKMEQRVLVILHDLHRSLCLPQVGIPFGADHPGCKILLTSTNSFVLSDQMSIQRIIVVL